MWSTRLSAILTVAATLVAAAGPAAADGGQGDPLYGDLNLDRLPDRVVVTGVGGVQPGRCPVRVELGRAGGGYQAARTYTYPVPGGALGYCPDMGVIVDLGGDGRVEIVLAWFDGRPSDVDHDLLVLRDFTPVTGFDAIYQPSYIRLADFNGDGRQDVYQWTDQGDGFRSFLNTADGRLVPGPVRFTQFCTSDPDFELADFHRNGGRGLAIAYLDYCNTFSSGVAVVGYDGVRTDLEFDEFGEQWWAMDVLDANADGNPDVRTDNEVTGEITHFLGLGDGTFAESPRAVADRAIAAINAPTVIPILANDRATRQSSVTITIPPKFGRVTVNPNRTVSYSLLGPHDGGDRFVYRLNQDGKQHTTSVSIRFPA
nr:hypothetical protein [Micromonospora sp. DSM 115978]